MFLLPFFLAGLLFFWAGLNTISQGSSRYEAMVVGFALVFLAFPAVMLLVVLRRLRQREQALEERQALPHQPWLGRAD